YPVDRRRPRQNRRLRSGETQPRQPHSGGTCVRHTRLHVARTIEWRSGGWTFDLFSLGVILYTVLTGYRPFQGNSALTVSFKVVNHEPMPATLLDTELPQGL